MIAAADDGHLPTPVVDSYLGQLRIRYTGTGPVDVHVGEDVDFRPSEATLVGSLAVAGFIFAMAPVGVDRFVRFIDRYGNRSATVRGAVRAVAQITADGGFFPGRFQTALTGARGEAEGASALALVLERWAAVAETEAAHALTVDELGRAARLRGKAEGLRLAVAELGRLRPAATA